MKKQCLALGLAFAAFGASSAFAATSTINSFTVSITITAGCTISATNINFGSVPGQNLLTGPLTSTAGQGGLFSYQCTANTGTSPTLTAGPGLHPTGTQAFMKGTANGALIPYSLTIPPITAFNGQAQSVQMSATIPTQTIVPSVDAYSDTVTLTLTY
jgi:spore coat protein U-like protein